MATCTNCGRNALTRTIPFYTARIGSQERSYPTSDKVRVKTTYTDISAHCCEVCGLCLWLKKYPKPIAYGALFLSFVAMLILSYLKSPAASIAGTALVSTFVVGIAAELVSSLPYKAQRLALRTARAAAPDEKWVLLSEEEFQKLSFSTPRS